ncbi:hypothetical protein TeGR_g2755 [Tetraparma gracilis]|uniref:Cupin 2 conserved barrel domain-containing protein n=1 Tax=Tetraparma gracilis TaxID=2962635 RepID=A0ABQ6M3Q6_9STRA|nr:hypothetical protein TeGR_g2755 [Tetraparma gracilis]
MAPVLAHLSLASAELPWKVPKTLSSSYKDKMQDEMVSAMLVGNPEFGAILESATYYVGLMVIRPGVDYPRHAHDAAETFSVLRGEATWWKEGEGTRVVRPGEAVVHESKRGHGVVTGEEELVCLYLWGPGGPGAELLGRYWFTNDEGGCVDCGISGMEWAKGGVCCVGCGR